MYVVPLITGDGDPPPGHVVDPPPHELHPEAAITVNERLFPIIVVFHIVESREIVVVPTGNETEGVIVQIPFAPTMVEPRIVPERVLILIVAPELPIHVNEVRVEACPQERVIGDFSVNTGVI